MTRFFHLLLRLLAPAALVAAGVGLVLGRGYAEAGFDLLAVETVRRTVLRALLGTVVFLAVFTAVRALAGARLRTGFAVALAAAVASVPFALLAGYQLNRSLAIRPSEILEPYALVPNLLLLAGLAAAYVVVCALLVRLDEPRGAPWRWPAVAAVAALAVFHVALTFAFRAEQKSRPDVLILLVDALRADHLGSYGYHRDTTPSIDALARDGVIFLNAVSHSTFTKTSIASLFTSRNPYEHGLYWGNHQTEDGTWSADVLHDDETTLAELLSAGGYLTAAWVQNSHLRRVMGFAQGFTEYHDQQGSIERINRRFLDWFRRAGRRYNYFAYLHYIDLHDPYLPKPPYDTLYGSYSDVYAGVDFDEWGGYLQAVERGEIELSDADVEQLRAYYDGQLRAIDEQIGALLEELKASGLYDETLIVVTADHGDGFMEHGFISHSTTPYDELVRVPLIVKLPGGRFAGREVDAQVRLIDLLPTIVEEAAVEAKLDVASGCSLLPRLTGEPLPEEKLCDLAVIEIAKEDTFATLALRTDRFKYIVHGAADDELYDLVEDPGELHDLARVREADRASLSRIAHSFIELRGEASGDRVTLGAQTVRELKRMGYVGD